MRTRAHIYISRERERESMGSTGRDIFILKTKGKFTLNVPIAAALV